MKLETVRNVIDKLKEIFPKVHLLNLSAEVFFVYEYNRKFNLHLNLLFPYPLDSITPIDLSRILLSKFKYAFIKSMTHDLNPDILPIEEMLFGATIIELYLAEEE